MNTVLVSPKFQIVIPKTVRKQLNMQAGMRMQVVLYGECIELIPVRSPKSMRGFIKGINTDVEREDDRL